MERNEEVPKHTHPSGIGACLFVLAIVLALIFGRIEGRDRDQDRRITSLEATVTAMQEARDGN